MSNVAALPATWQHEQAGTTETVEQLIRRAHETLVVSGPMFSASKISRLIRERVKILGIASASALIDYYALNYTDPTGETAVRNFMAVKR